MNIQKLLPQQRALYENHLKRLNWNDRMMRFESSVSDDYIENYVRAIPEGDAIFAILDDTGTLIAAAHVAVKDRAADLGLSVEISQRYQGLGTALLEGAIGWAHAEGMKRFSSQCLSHNRWMTTRMRRMGFTIVTERGTTYANVHMNDDDDFSSFLHEMQDADLSTTSYGEKVWFRGKPKLKKQKE